MNEEGAISSKKHYFWGYDIFGYLSPGALFALIAAKSNSWIYDQLAGHWKNPKMDLGINIVDIVVLLFFVYILGHIISGISSFILERLILRHTLKYPTYRMFNETKVSGFWRFFFPGYFRPYSKEFRTSIVERYQDRFPQLVARTHDLFWVCFSWISINHPTAYRRSTHFLELYGFSRNICMSFILIACLPILPEWTGFVDWWVLSGVSLVIAVIMFINYTKLLRRLNDEVYRGFYVGNN
jgi:hypothetical protein